MPTPEQDADEILEMIKNLPDDVLDHLAAKLADRLVDQLAIVIRRRGHV